MKSDEAPDFACEAHRDSLNARKPEEDLRLSSSGQRERSAQTANDEPQPQEPRAWGLLNLNPAPVLPST